MKYYSTARLMLPKLPNMESGLSLRILPGQNRLIFLQSLFLAKMGMNCWSVSIIKSHISSAMMSTMIVAMRCLKNVTVRLSISGRMQTTFTSKQCIKRTILESRQSGKTTSFYENRRIQTVCTFPEWSRIITFTASQKISCRQNPDTWQKTDSTRLHFGFKVAALNFQKLLDYENSLVYCASEKRDSITNTRKIKLIFC